MADKEKKGRRLYAPMDVCEMDDHYTVWMEMPGVAKEGLEIKVEGNELEITGELPATEDNGKYLQVEFPREGYYHGIITISDEIDTEKIGAKLTDGVLELSLPKKEEMKPREIPIEVE